MRSAQATILGAAHTVDIPVVRTLVRDPTCYTQGLDQCGDLIVESTGDPLHSEVRILDRTWNVVRRFFLPAGHFAEGVAFTSESIICLTWRTGVAYELDASYLTLKATISYAGEGWGLCADSCRENLYMTDGSNAVTQRKASDFTTINRHALRWPDTARNEILRLNDLSLTGALVIAHLYKADRLIAAERASGLVLAEIDLRRLLTDEERVQLHPRAEANGVAHDRSTDHTIIVTGKLWPVVVWLDLTGLVTQLKARGL